MSKRKQYKWLLRLIDRITKNTASTNDNFNYYGKIVTLQSGTVDFVAVNIMDQNLKNQIDFSFDFWTYELVFDGYNDYDERDAIIKGFRGIYSHVSVIDNWWDGEMKFVKAMLGNDDYDQDEVRKQYDELVRHEV